MRIAVIYPRANLDTVPSLIGAVELLAQHGCDVEVFTYRQAGQAPPAFNSPRIRLRWLGVEGLADHSTAGLRSAVKRAGWLQLPGVARAPLARTYQALGAGLAGGSRLAARARSVVMDREEPFACVVGVDPDGLILAHTLARDAPLVYYSLELLLSYELTTPTDRPLKSEERELSRLASISSASASVAAIGFSISAWMPRPSTWRATAKCPGVGTTIVTASTTSSSASSDGKARTPSSCPMHYQRGWPPDAGRGRAEHFSLGNTARQLVDHVSRLIGRPAAIRNGSFRHQRVG